MKPKLLAPLKPKLPEFVWILFGPDGVALRVYLNEPSDEELAWASAHARDRSWRDIPGDVIIAKRNGYRFVKARVAHRVLRKST